MIVQEYMLRFDSLDIHAPIFTDMILDKVCGFVRGNDSAISIFALLLC